MLQTLGGDSIKECLKTIFKYMFTNELLAKFCWRGSSTKARFQDLENVKKLICSVVQLHHEKVSFKDFDKFCKNYLKFAPYRKN